jgi:hypothetical protein
MLNEQKITFRCTTGPGVLYTPEYLHDVEAMRSHPEYEEVIVVDGEVVEVVKPGTSPIQRLPMNTAPRNASQAKPSEPPKRGRGRPRKS